MSLKVLKAGMLTSLQDLGRHGFMHLGVARGGVMDPISMKLANWLVGNTDNTPVLEITLIGPELQVLADMTIAVCGAPISVYVNRQPTANAQTLRLHAGDVVTFDRMTQGCRAYLAVAGEWQISKVLGSYGTDIKAQFAGFAGRPLQSGDILPLQALREPPARQLPVTLQMGYTGSYRVRILEGIEHDHFSVAMKARLAEQKYRVLPTSDRMGIRLTGLPVKTSSELSLLSMGVVPGTVQIPPAGEPIIMAADAQTMGGYPRIAQLASVDLSLLGQLTSNNQLQFEWITMTQAATLYRQQQQTLAKIKRLLA